VVDRAGLPSERWIYSPSSSETVSVSGPLGDTVVEIRDGRARIARSPCPGQDCVRAGWIHGAGAASACLPNRVSVRIEGGSKRNSGEADAVAW
jgi:hypothetical protein